MYKNCYLLDTNMLGYLAEVKLGVYTTEGKAIQKRLDQLKGEKIFICCISVGEIEYGLKIAPYMDTSKQNSVRDIVQSFYSYPINGDIARGQYADLRAKLFDHCSPRNKRQRDNNKKRIEEWIDPTTSKELQVQENDIWIAAVAMTYNFVLVTHDKMKILKTVAGDNLLVEDWTKP